MSGTLTPRVVVVRRRSELEELLARHGTRAAAQWYLRARGRDLAEVVDRHEALQTALTAVGAAVPADWRRGTVDRDDLPRFLFGPEDVIVAVGPDGLVANVAKYLTGQPVVGVDPEPGRNAGVLVRCTGDQVAALLPAVAAGTAPLRHRAMVRATLDDGQELVGLNEVYVGHSSHQSARYLLDVGGDGRPRQERQSSSGVVVGTGTGATGWCASIARDRSAAVPPPAPQEPALCWYVREAWPSPVTGVELVAGRLDGTDALELTAESDGLVAFADGLEADRLTLRWGQRVRLDVAPGRLALVEP
ncbi:MULTISPECIES: NAD(+)/NADH kinase [Micromonospora]|uniref:NAD(+)/NADH kinase n=1 Tax=Micromonospora antibiotica TaxID=2807623 RepID=A0ABS3V1V4_9ACTN|nr:NAD(+)/NADH kinase [Micromonospora antibiotica]MBO4159595.1 NAD(+)/NADH kinase [Micromonospora antibiotica]